MSPLRSSAGPATGRMPTPSSRADDVRERRLAEPGRAGEQDVVERLAARLRRVERDRELLLHALLADEVVERLRAQRALELLLVGSSASARATRSRHHAACRSAARTCSSTGSSSSTSGERALGVERATSRARRARRARAASRRPPRRRWRDAGRRASPSARARRAARSCGRSRGSPRSAPCPRARSRGAARRRRAGDDRERDLRPDAGHAEQQLEQLALVGRREAVELERVLAHVEVGLDASSPSPTRALHRAASRRRGSRRRRRRRRARGVRAATVPRAARSCREGTGAGGHLTPTARRSGGASAWQIATASASEAWSASAARRARGSP